MIPKRGRDLRFQRGPDLAKFNRTMATLILLAVGAWIAVVLIAVLGGVHLQISFGGLEASAAVVGNSAGESLEGKRAPK